MRAGSELWESSREDLKTFDSFIERLREDKTEKVYRNCKFQDSSPAHKLSPRNLGAGVSKISDIIYLCSTLEKGIKE